MQHLLRGLLLVWCVWTEIDAKKAAEVAITVIDSGTGNAVNTTYSFGIYGASSLTRPVSGRLVHVHSEGNVNDGCNDYNHDLPTQYWVALIERGQCYFSEKIRIATKRYNASAVIVYDNQRTTSLVSMHSFVKDEVYIFVKQTIGRRLALLVDAGLHVHVNITAGQNSSSAETVMPHTAVYGMAIVLWLVSLWV